MILATRAGADEEPATTRTPVMQLIAVPADVGLHPGESAFSTRTGFWSPIGSPFSW